MPVVDGFRQIVLVIGQTAFLQPVQTNHGTIGQRGGFFCPHLIDGAIVTGIGEHGLSEIVVGKIRGVKGHVVVDVIIQGQNHIIFNGCIVAAGIQLKYAVDEVAVIASCDHQIELVAFGFHRALVPVDADPQVLLNPLVALHIRIAGHQIGQIMLDGNPIAQLQGFVEQREVIAFFGVAGQLAGFGVGIRDAGLGCRCFRCCGCQLCLAALRVLCGDGRGYRGGSADFLRRGGCGALRGGSVGSAAGGQAAHEHSQSQTGCRKSFSFHSSSVPADMGKKLVLASTLLRPVYGISMVTTMSFQNKV